MSMIKVENLTFSYPSSCDNIFEDVSFQIDTNWKLGFVGRNGRGKTTFLNLLLGKYTYSGTITSSVQFDYFPYPVDDKNKLTEDILREICPAAQEWEFIRELSYLEVGSDVLWRTFDTLSNGEQTKILLAALFLKEGHFLLIDEPTNHLDARARELGALNFERRQAFETAQNELLQKDISRLQKAARKTSDWSNKTEAAKYGNGPVDRGYIGHKSAKMMQRSKAIKARQQKAIEQKSGLLKNVETAESLKLFPRSYHAETLASFSDVEIFYGKTAACAPVSFSILQGDRLVLDGRNGSGKSSLLKLLVGEELKYTGTVMIGSGLIISYVPQNTSHLQGRLHSFAAEHHIDESLFKAVLRKMDFERIQFEKDISNFSEGQKKKVLIAKSLCEQAHLYVWDEPLNFIDIYSRIQIEQLIKEFSPAMIFVEHDKAFRDGISTKIISL